MRNGEPQVLDVGGPVGVRYLECFEATPTFLRFSSRDPNLGLQNPLSEGQLKLQESLKSEAVLTFADLCTIGWPSSDRSGSGGKTNTAQRPLGRC
jgi:hypothetical protein